MVLPTKLAKADMMEREETRNNRYGRESACDPEKGTYPSHWVIGAFLSSFSLFLGLIEFLRLAE